MYRSGAECLDISIYTSFSLRFWDRLLYPVTAGQSLWAIHLNNALASYCKPLCCRIIGLRPNDHNSSLIVHRHFVGIAAAL